MLDRMEALPAVVHSHAVESSFLVLGSSLRDWSLRVLLRLLWRRLPLRFKSWAVMRSPSAFDVEYWRHRDVEVFDVDLEEYAAGRRDAAKL